MNREVLRGLNESVSKNRWGILYIKHLTEVREYIRMGKPLGTEVRVVYLRL